MCKKTKAAANYDFKCHAALRTFLSNCPPPFLPLLVHMAQIFVTKSTTKHLIIMQI